MNVVTRLIHRGRLLAAALVAATVLSAPTAWAQVTWDANTTTSGPQDGSGTWSTSDANWWNGTTDVVWPNLTTSSAVIGANNGAAGTITASGSLTLNAITFNAPGSGTYTLTGGTLGFAGSSPTITANANATIESAIVSTGLTKSGTGNLTLAGVISNTSGAMSFSRGTVTLTGTLTYTSASTFAIGSSNGGTLTIAGGTFSANGGGGARQLVIAGGAGQSGTVAVNSGFFSAVGMLVSEDGGGNGVFTQSGGTTTIGASNLWLTGNSSTLTVSGGSFTTPTMYTNFGGSNSATTINVSGSGSLTATSVQVGTATRNGINFNLNVGDGTGGGVFQANTFSWGGATGTATINFNSGTFVGNATHSLPTQIATVVKSGGANISVAASQTLTMSNPLTDGSGGGGLRKLGAGTLSLTGSNTYTGTTSIAAGSLSIGNALALQNSTLNLDASDTGTVSAISQNSTLGGLTGSRNLDMLTRTLSIGNNGASTTYSGTLSNGALTKIGSGTLTLTASNSYTGATAISAGALALSTAGSLVSTGTVAITGSGATFDISGASAGRTIGMITGTAGSSVTLGANSLTVGDATSGTFAGGIGGTGGFTKQGAGTLGLSGSNSYSGGTTINNGTIMLSGAGTLGSGTAGLTLGGGALDLGGLSVSAGNVSITSVPASGNQIQNGTLTGTAFSVSNTSGVSTISASLAGAGAALSKSGAGTLVLSGSNSFSGGVTLTGGQVQIANANALGTGVFTTNVDAETTIPFNLATSATVANAITINKPGSNRIYRFQQNQSNNLTLAGNITMASGNTPVFQLNTGVASGTFTLTGSNTFGGDVYTNANVTFRIGGTNAAGTGIWRPDLTTKLVLLDGANFRAIMGNAIASFSMESSGTATVSGDVFNRNTANVAVNLPAGAQLTFSNNIRAEGGSTTGTFSKTGAGTWVVNNTVNQMTYNVLEGTMQVSSFSGIGPTSTASFLVLNGGTLRYTGAAASSTREFTLGASGGSLDASGSGTAAFTSTAAVSFTGSGNRTLTLTGTNTGNNSLAMALNDNGADVVSLSKTGAGTWSLSGSNSYSGGTTLSAGRLNVNNASALGGGAGNLVVTGGTLDLGNYAIARSGTVSITGGTIQSGTLTNDTVAYDAQAGTVSAALAGAAGLTKSTSGTVTLSGSNTFGGGVALSAGRLNVNNATALGTGTFTITGGTIDNTSGGAVTLTANNAQNWNNDVTFIGSNALNLGSGAVTLGADRVVTVTSSTLAVGGAIGGAYTLTKAGGGTLVLSASNTRTQATTINAGTISLTGLSGTGTQPSASDLANTPITINTGATLLAGATVAGQNSHLINQDLVLNGGTLASNGVSGNNNYNFAIGGSARIIAGGGTTSTISASLGVQGTKEFQVGAGSTLTASGVIGNWEGQSWGTINKTGDGTLALTSNGNNYGGLVLNAGTVAVSSGAWANTNGPGYRADFQGNATLQWAAGNTTDISASNKLRIGDGVTASLDTGANAVTLGTAIVTGAGKTGGLTKLGSGTLTISGSNSFTGDTTVSAGELRVGAGGTTGLLSSSLISVGSGATLAFNRSDNYGGAFASLIGGSGGVRVDSGFLDLTAANSYTGATSVLAGGTLAVNGSLGGGGLTIASGAALMGSGTIGGLTTIAGMHMPGNSPGVETFTNLTYNSGASVQWELWGNTTANSPLAFDQVVVGGDITFSGATTLTLAFTGSAGPSNFSTVDWTNPFWGTNQEWLLYDVGGTTGSFGNLALSTANWQDSTGAFFQAARPDGSFKVEQRGSDVYIVYAAVPEPTGLALAGIGTALAAWIVTRGRRRRRRSRDG